MMKWSIDTKNCYDGLKIYKGYKYVVVSKIDRNHSKSVTGSFKTILELYASISIRSGPFSF